MTTAHLLAFESQHSRHTPTKTQRIRHELGISEVRYYVLLARAAQSAEGIAAHPATARMIRERASRRAAERAGRIARCERGAAGAKKCSKQHILPMV